MVRMCTLANNLVLRMLLLISLYLTDHRNVILHTNIIVNIDTQIVSILLVHGTSLDINQVYTLLAAIFLREVEVRRSD